MDEKDGALLQKQLHSSAQRAYEAGIYTYTDFLGTAEIDTLLRMERELGYAGITLWGGAENCERKIARFGTAENCGYEEAFPIALLEVKPLSQKFADKLTHRDILGALMHLGIDRDTVGDIFISENVAYVFTVRRMAEMICRELTRASHTALTCTQTDALPDSLTANEKQIIVTVASVRADVLTAAVFGLSRETAAQLFRQEKVFLNGRLIPAGKPVPDGGIVSVRGFGRFRCDGVESVSKKGKPRTKITVFQ